MDYPKVGVATIIIGDKLDKVLLGKRKGSHGGGTWSFPGGKLEMFEPLDLCAKREVKEETGLDIIVNSTPCAVTNDFFKEYNQHYITLYMRAEGYVGIPKVMEPDKCEEWKWFQWGKLPSDLFLPIKNLISTGYNPLL